MKLAITGLPELPEEVQQHLAQRMMIMFAAHGIPMNLNIMFLKDDAVILV